MDFKYIVLILGTSLILIIGGVTAYVLIQTADYDVIIDWDVATTTVPVVTTQPIITTTMPIIKEATITKIEITGRCPPLPRAYGCCHCIIWENGEDNNLYASATRYDNVTFDIYIIGSGLVYVQFHIYHNPYSFIFSRDLTKEISLDSGENKITFVLAEIIYPLPVTGLHDVDVKVFEDEQKQDLLFDTGRIAWPLDVF